ncbi:MAG: transglutaminase domain-containing protein [Deltaproteobacteria bacterium]|nr:transglutaminase domain-containing protein [Deltaproteobacteria bacterium]
MRERKAESSLVSVLRAAVMTVTAAALTFDLALPAGVVAAILGTLVGVVAGHLLARTALRLAVLWLLGIAVMAAGLGAAGWVTGSDGIAASLGPLGALALADALRFGLLFAGGVAAVRASGARHQEARLVEVAAVTFALVRILAVHREGAINRPLFLADWAFSRGIDPVMVLLWIGGVGALTLVVLLLHERRGGRVLVHLLALGLLAPRGLAALRWGGPPQKPAAADTLGLRGKGPPPPPSRQKRTTGDGGGQGQSQDRRDAEEMPFRDDFEDQGKEVPVAVVVFKDDYSPPTGLYYFRQTAFSQFNGHRLVAATRPDADRDLVRLFPAQETEVAPPWQGRERRELATVVALMSDHTRPFALDYPSRLTPLENPDPARFRRAYEATSFVLAEELRGLVGRKVGLKAWANEVWAHYQQYPEDSRYEQLAGEIVAGLPEKYRRDPVAQALAIKVWLDQNGIYSRRSQHAGADDPTADFLFGDKTGYCVHFAHAAAFLLRARGLPARVAAGYAATEAARGNGSSLLLRAGDAHAWPELYLDGVGWVPFDPAPERSLDQSNRPPDPGLQRMLGEMVKKSKPTPPPPGVPEAARAGLRSLATALRASLPFLLTLLLLLYAVKAYRRFAPAFAPAAALPRLCYRAALDVLAEAGLRRDFGETREAFARRAAPLAPTLGALTVVHSGAALGARATPAAPRTLALQQAVGAEVTARAPWWRRLFGLLNPLSFMGSK